MKSITKPCEKTMASRKTVSILILCIGLFLSIRNASAETTSPEDRVRSMLTEVMAVQSDPALKGDAFVEKRKAAIQSIISKNFDFNAMSRSALGSYWQKLNQDQRAEFQHIFRDLFQDSYTRMVLNFLKQEKVDFIRQEIRKSHAQILTRIIRTKEEIPVEYSLSEMQKNWIVQDVKIDGVSIIENYRKAFFRIIQQQSYDALLKRMRLQQQAIKK